jgi:hypothetical protein
MTEYRIWATCSGSMGYREAWLKNNDEIYQTKSRAAAEKKARQLQENVSPYSTAHFSYSVVEA